MYKFVRGRVCECVSKWTSECVNVREKVHRQLPHHEGCICPERWLNLRTSLPAVGPSPV